MEYKDFLKDKKVALIGPSISVEGTKRGGYIDSFDVVVRMIRPRIETELIPARLEKDIGSVTHVLYSNFPPGGNTLSNDYMTYLIEQGVRYVNATQPGRDRYLNLSPNLLSCGVTKTKDEKWNRELRSRPHTGFSILLDLLSYDIKELYILGYSFYKDSVIEEWLLQNKWARKRYDKDCERVTRKGDVVSDSDDVKNWRREPRRHNNAKELIYFKKEILAKDPRVKVDDSMLEFLK